MGAGWLEPGGGGSAVPVGGPGRALGIGGKAPNLDGAPPGEGKLGGMAPTGGGGKLLTGAGRPGAGKPVGGGKPGVPKVGGKPAGGGGRALVGGGGNPEKGLGRADVRGGKGKSPPPINGTGAIGVSDVLYFD